MRYKAKGYFLIPRISKILCSKIEQNLNKSKKFADKMCLWYKNNYLRTLLKELCQIAL